MDLGKKIQQVLKHYPSVYIDGLGVFRKVHQASSFDEQRNVFLPPIDYIEFDELGQQGLDLVDYLRQENEITRTDAQELVAREVATITSSIAEQGKAHIPQLGDLLTYGDGFVFRAVDLSSFVFEPISNIERPEKPAAPSEDTVAPTIDQDEVTTPENDPIEETFAEEAHTIDQDEVVAAPEEEDFVATQESDTSETTEEEQETATEEVSNDEEGTSEEESIVEEEVVKAPEEEITTEEEDTPEGESIVDEKVVTAPEEVATTEEEETTEVENIVEQKVVITPTQSTTTTTTTTNEVTPVAPDPREESYTLRESTPLIQNKYQGSRSADFVPAEEEPEVDYPYVSEYVEDDNRSNILWYILAAVTAISIIGALWYVTRPASLYSGDQTDIDDETEILPYATDEDFILPNASTELLDTSSVLRERPDTTANPANATPAAIPANQPVIPANHNWYIVIGSRLPLDDAKEMVSEYQKKGQARVRIIPGRGENSPATVIWDSYVTKEKADSALRHVRKNFVADAWHKAIKK